MGKDIIKTANCPFCGGKTKIDRGIQMYAVQCLERGCEANVMFTGKEFDPGVLAEAWKKRTKKTHRGASYIRDVATDLEPPEGLKACPFCGNTNLNYRKVYGNISIECADCGADVGFYTSRTDAEVCEHWNRRV